MLAAKSLTIPGRLKDVSAALAPGAVTAIVGPNGAGKSTLLAAFAGLISGPVALDGIPLAALSPQQRAQTIGFLPQDGEVAWNLSVETLARLGRLPHKTGRAEDDAATAAALSALDLERFAARSVGTLSGGERARALLARVLAGTPRWILADEPLAALDLSHQQALLRQFRLLAGQGTGIALVLHDLAQARNHADRVIVLQDGRVAAEGPPHEALTEEVILKVWGVAARWTGPETARALSLDRT